MTRPSVTDFGAVGDGSETSIAVNNAAFEAAALAGDGHGGFTIPGGVFMISQPVTVNYSYCSIEGDDRFSTNVVTMAQDDVFVFDFSDRPIDFAGISDLQMTFGGNAKPASGAGVRLKTTQANPQHGMSHFSVKDVTARFLKQGLLADKPGMGLWGGVPSIAHYGHIMIDGLHIPYSNLWTEHGVKFKGGPGAHNSFRNSNMAVTIAGVEMGDGSSDCGVGDQLFDSLHITDGQHGIVIYGPATWGRYNQNITIDGCQFDGITASTVKMRRMENFRIRDCNSTASATYDLATCRRYSVQEAGAYGSEYSISPASIGPGSWGINLFDVEVDPAEQYRSIYAEIYIDTVFGGIGNRPLLWRGFLAYWSGSTWTIDAKEVLTLGPNVSLSFTPMGTKVRCSLHISGATAQCKYDGTFKLTGRNYSVTKLY